jgi:long-subunit acyl-CoA synthetase (AMP-forming)
MFQSITTVALYTTLGEEATKMIIEETELSTIACDQNHVAEFLKYKKEECSLPPNQ